MTNKTPAIKIDTSLFEEHYGLHPRDTNGTKQDWVFQIGAMRFIVTQSDWIDARYMARNAARQAGLTSIVLLLE